MQIKYKLKNTSCTVETKEINIKKYLLLLVIVFFYTIFFNKKLPLAFAYLSEFHLCVVL